MRSKKISLMVRFFFFLSLFFVPSPTSVASFCVSLFSFFIFYFAILDYFLFLFVHNQSLPIFSFCIFTYFFILANNPSWVEYLSHIQNGGDVFVTVGKFHSQFCTEMSHLSTLDTNSSFFVVLVLSFFLSSFLSFVSRPLNYCEITKLSAYIVDVGVFRI